MNECASISLAWYDWDRTDASLRILAFQVSETGKESVCERRYRRRFDAREEIAADSIHRGCIPEDSHHSARGMSPYPGGLRAEFREVAAWRVGFSTSHWDI